MTARLDDLAQPGVEALDGIGRVDHPTDRRREGEEGNDPIPRLMPGLRISAIVTGHFIFT
jgi:hypothetical protein